MKRKNIIAIVIYLIYFSFIFLAPMNEGIKPLLILIGIIATTIFVFLDQEKK